MTSVALVPVVIAIASTGAGVTPAQPVHYYAGPLLLTKARTPPDLWYVTPRCQQQSLEEL